MFMGLHGSRFDDGVWQFCISQGPQALSLGLGFSWSKDYPRSLTATTFDRDLTLLVTPTPRPHNLP